MPQVLWAWFQVAKVKSLVALSNSEDEDARSRTVVIWIIFWRPFNGTVEVGK